ncbi:hypothetical protein F5Y08DRAFT_348236 [Xylaria arbuscula]|nr:hypothetical protein F5Y08DRAFT_348236 [Xylaria arbuscula]
MLLLRCACIRCNYGNILNPNRRGYYPHYGTNLIPNDRGKHRVVFKGSEIVEYTHLFVAKKHLCESAQLDSQGYWLGCKGRRPPPMTRIEDRYVGRHKNPGRHSVCNECKKTCYRIQRLDESGSEDLLDLLEASEDGDDPDDRPAIVRYMGQAVNTANRDQGQEQERVLSMRERIYRNVLYILGYPDNTPIPWDPDPPTASPSL